MSQYLIIDDHPLIAEAIDYFVRKHVGDYDQLVLKSSLILLFSTCI